MDDVLPRDGNRVPTAGAQSTTNADTVLPIEINPANGGVVVDVVTS